MVWRLSIERKYEKKKTFCGTESHFLVPTRTLLLTGMTDGNAAWRLQLYGLRAQLHHPKDRTTGRPSGQPILLAYHTGNRAVRANAVTSLEDRGLAALVSDDENVVDAVLAAVPDTFGLTELQIAALPTFVRDFKCNGAIESGEPYCFERKFNMTICPDRKGMTSWHPGWRWHAVMGNLAALYLLDSLEAALMELLPLTTTSSKTKQRRQYLQLQDKLQRKEDVDYEHFFRQPVIDDIGEMFSDEQERAVVNLTALVLGDNYCHTARLPAQIRYRGILTEPLSSSSSSSLTKTTIDTSTRSTVHSDRADDYDLGIGMKEVQSTANPTDAMRLVYDEEDRANCPVKVHMDYRDYFYVDGRDDWTKLVLPNDSEIKEYGSSQGGGNVTLQGMVAFCVSICPWLKCPPGALERDGLADGSFHMQVNGVQVSALTKMGECELLKHEGGYVFPLSAQGKLEIRTKVSAGETSFLHFSSFIVW
jgi:hypothetical protein